MSNTPSRREVFREIRKNYGGSLFDEMLIPFTAAIFFVSCFSSRIRSEIITDYRSLEAGAEPPVPVPPLLSQRLCGTHGFGYHQAPASPYYNQMQPVTGRFG